MDEIKKLKFVETIIIVNGKLFYNFVKKFNENLKDICIIPKIVVYSPNIKPLPLPNSIENKVFYTHFGIKKTPKEIKQFIEEEQKEKYSAKYPSPPLQNNTESIFVRIKNRGDLNLPSFYKILLDLIESKDTKFIEMMKIYQDDKKYKSLFNPITTIPDIPIELLSKYYARMYTINGNFFEKMKRDLLIDYNKNNILYQSYIKTIYEGV